MLTQRELNRAVLARQLLLERAKLPLPRAAERIAGLQTQYAPSGYVGLWSRLEGFERDDLTRALERRNVVQAMMMRNTIHIASKRDYWPLILAIRAERKAWSRRVQRARDSELERAAEKLRKALAGGPLTLNEMKALGADVWRPGAAIWLELVRVPPSGTWERRRADLYGLAEKWLGPPPKLSEDEAVDHLVRRYLGAFGPAPRTDIAGWAGMRVGSVTPALERLKLRRFVDEAGRELLDVPGAPLPHPDTETPVRFLPTFDATLLVHARRAGLLPERYRSRIFHSKAPQSFPTFLVGGAVAGTWRYQDGRIRLDPFERLSRATTQELEEEAERLAAFHA
ncbi:MAG: winged helix DNA-binding domain-containing protein [Actinobacteria bacterium]|nr:MAG: winged helix DNA-binding domain-containing protein [Actinomycetota bacterium]TMM27549.1 MAG: winged helix DNA-binding domain-containing protein [Actinomycetota bacterium]